jgi:hypothetical protein
VKNVTLTVVPGWLKRSDQAWRTFAWVAMMRTAPTNRPLKMASAVTMTTFASTIQWKKRLQPRGAFALTGDVLAGGAAAGTVNPVSLTAPSPPRSATTPRRHR